MTYRKRKKQCKRRLENKQRLNEIQIQFCWKHKLTGYLLGNAGIGISAIFEKISDDFTKATKSLATAFNEFAERFYDSFNKIDWQGISEGINQE